MREIKRFRKTMQEITKKHSILGIVSCVIGCLLFLFFLLSTVFYYLQFQNITASPPDEGLGVLQMFSVMILPIPVHVLCLISGVLSLFFTNRKKFFPILGIVLNLTFAVISLFPWLWLIIRGMGRV